MDLAYVQTSRPQPESGDTFWRGITGHLVDQPGFGAGIDRVGCVEFLDQGGEHAVAASLPRPRSWIRRIPLARSGMRLAAEVSNARSSLRAFSFLPWALITGAIMRVSAR